MFNIFGGQRCKLECTGDGIEPDRRHEFVGPVRIIFVEPSKEDYLNKVWGSAVLTFAYLLVIATVVPLLLYTLTYRLPLTVNLHVALCTIGFQLLIPTAILMIDPMFSASLYLDLRRRKRQHILLQVLAGICIYGGVINLYVQKTFEMTVHAIIGLVAMAFVFLATVLGLFTVCLNRNYKGEPPQHPITKRHSTVGIITLLVALLPLGSALFTPAFGQWYVAMDLYELPFILIAFSVIYTMCITWSVFWREVVS